MRTAATRMMSACVALVLVACASATASPSPATFPSSAASPSVEASEAPSQSVPVATSTPRVELTPSPSATAQPASPRGPTLTVNGKSPVWAPDSAHFATSAGGENIYDAGGTLVRQCEFSSPRWLDATHLVGLGVDQIPPFRGFICDIEDGTTTTIDLPESPEYALANGHGAVALAWPTGGDWRNPYYDFVVWGDGASTKPQEGSPELWSEAGSELVVTHQAARNGSGGGATIASWPGLDQLYVSPRGWDASGSLFDPSGRYVSIEAFDDDLRQNVSHLVDLSTGHAIDLPGNRDNMEWWTADERLSVAVGGRLTDVFSTDGTLIASTMSPGSIGVASADGSTVAYADLDTTTGMWQPTVEVVRNSQATAFRLPAVGLGSTFAVSPDGQAIVVSGADLDSVSYLLTDY